MNKQLVDESLALALRLSVLIQFTDGWERERMLILTEMAWERFKRRYRRMESSIHDPNFRFDLKQFEATEDSEHLELECGKCRAVLRFGTHADPLLIERELEGHRCPTDFVM